MTVKRRDKHSTEFGLWLREQECIDSKLGFVATNLDYIWRNYKTGKWMLIEEKRYMSNVSYPQKQCFAIMDRVSKSDPSYQGFYLIQFKNTSPDDGEIYINNKEVSKSELLDFLMFKKRCSNE